MAKYQVGDLVEVKITMAKITAMGLTKRFDEKTGERTEILTYQLEDGCSVLINIKEEDIYELPTKDYSGVKK